jgi:HK97 family phage portal protein
MVWPFADKRSLSEKASAGAKLTNEEWRQLSFIDGFWPDAGGASKQGVVSVSRALALVPVFGAVRTIADSIASLTPSLYTRENGLLKRQPVPSLFAQPSIHGSMYEWLFRAAASMCLNGDAIGLITATDYYGFPTMIEWLNPEQVATNDGKMYGPGSYMNPMWWWWGRPIDPKMLLHIPWFSMPWRVRGLSPIGAYALAINTGIGAMEFQANWFGQGGVPPGVMKNAERIIDPKDADALSNRLTARMQSRKPLVYGRDWDYTPIAIKPHEAQFVESMQLTAAHIAVIYGIPPRKLGGSTGESMTYSTAELDNLDFLTTSLRPWLRRLEYALTKCFPKGWFVKFDTDDMLMLDAKTRSEIDNTSLGFQNMGWKNQDEVRASRDMPPMAKTQDPQHVPIAVAELKPPPLPPKPDEPKPDANGKPASNGKTTSNGREQISNTNKALAGAAPASGGRSADEMTTQQKVVETMRLRWTTP